MARTIEDQTRNVFGRLLVLKTATLESKRSAWLCLCSCGSVVVVKDTNLKLGKTQSCGCLAKDRLRERNRTHGMSETPEYFIYKSAEKRCTNSQAKDYARYGGRGIKFLFKSFEEFIRCVGVRPSVKHSIDRIDSAGNYEPGNVRWATATEQANNRRSSIRVTIDGVTKTVSEWCGGSRTAKANKCYKRIKEGCCPVCAIKDVDDCKCEVVENI